MDYLISAPIQQHCCDSLFMLAHFSKDSWLDVEVFLFRDFSPWRIDSYRQNVWRRTIQCLSWVTTENVVHFDRVATNGLNIKKEMFLVKHDYSYSLEIKRNMKCVLLDISAMPSVIHQVQNANELLFLWRIQSRSNICHNKIMDQVHGRMKPTKWLVFYSVVRIFRIVS